MSGAHATHFVEDDVLACFNAAHAEAVWRAASHVELAHLVLAMSRQTSAADLFSTCGLDADVVAAVAASALPPLVMSRSETSRPATSEDLAHLLAVTRETATLHGARYLTLRHILGTLLNPPRTLRYGETVSRWFWAARRYPGGRARERSLADRNRAAVEPNARACDDDERRLLLALLDKQERLLEALIETAKSQPPPASVVVAADEGHALQPVVAAASAARSQKSAVVIPLDDLGDDEPTEPGQEPDPELEKLGVKRYYLSLDDDVVRAPSIGPRTAARLHPHGITQVKHLLSCEPERLSVRLGARHITASRIVMWKNQARLVCTIPWLRGTHAQLLVGAGYSSIDRILSTDRSTVCAAVMQFATTKDGQAILRAGPPPELDRIMRWIENSQQAEPQRAQIGRILVN